MTLRILVLTATLGVGGAGIACERFVRAVQHQNIHVDVESLNYSSSGKSLKIRNFRARLNRFYERSVFRFLHSNPNTDYKSVNWLPFNTLKGVSLKSYDVIHIHWINYGFMGLNQLNKVPNKTPLVWTLHSYWPFSSPRHYPETETIGKFEFSDKKIQMIGNRIRAWILPSDGMRESLPDHILTKVIHNPLPEQVTRGGIERSFSSNYLFVASGDIFEQRKGLVDLLEVWICRPEKHRNARLTIVGASAGFDNNSLIVELAKKRGAIFLGQTQDSRHMQTLMRTTDAIFVPSYQETFCQVISEGLAAGCPIIIRDSIESKNEFSNFKKYLKIIDFCQESFNSSLDWTKKLKFSREKLALSAQDYFSSQKIGRMAKDLYDDVLNQDGAKGV